MRYREAKMRPGGKRASPRPGKGASSGSECANSCDSVRLEQHGAAMGAALGDTRHASRTGRTGWAREPNVGVAHMVERYINPQFLLYFSRASSADTLSTSLPY